MKKLLFAVCAFALAVPQANAQTQQVRVTVTSNAPDNGVALTPLWFGFHDGSFDSYNGGLSSQPGLERIAEDGDVGQISSDFLSNLTYIDNSTGTAASATVASSQTVGRQDGVLVADAGGSPPPIQPGESVTSAIFNLDASYNNYFSYASMVLPSNDFYVANGNPFAHGLGDVFAGGSVSFNIGVAGTVNDAGTEINDFANSPGNPLFGIPEGQTVADQGDPENGVNANVIGDPFANFLNVPSDVDFGPLNFNNYSNGIATVTITAVPEPGSIGFVALGLGGLFLRRRRS